MNLLSLVTFLRVNILDSTGGVGVDWANINASDYDSIQLRWTNEELVDNINEAINQVYRRIYPVMDTLEVTTSAGVSTYNLPSNILKVISVKGDNGILLEETSMEHLWNCNPFTARFKYYVIQEIDNSLYLYPTPTEVSKVNLLFYRLPSSKLTWTVKTGVPALKEEYQLPMLYYAAHLCYLKDEETTKDPQRATYFREMFDREFPFTSAYANVRRSREAKYSSGHKQNPYAMSKTLLRR